MSFLSKKLSFFLILTVFASVLVFQNQQASWEWGSCNDTESTGSTATTDTED